MPLPVHLALAICTVLAFAAALASCSSRPSAGPAEPETIDIPVDGAAVSATYYPSPALSAPSLLLLPQPGSGRAGWTAFARAAQRQGYASLAIGLSPSSDSRSTRDFDAADWLELFDTIGAAKSALLARGADPENLAIAGAGVTANLALRYAASAPDMQAVILLSPGLEYDGLAIDETIRAVGKRPVFIAVMDGDAYSHSSSLQLHEWAAGYCELRVYQGAAHGTDMFSTAANVAEQILLWLKPILVPQRA